jgi:exodeoxyribonuclease V alpha subunit
VAWHDSGWDGTICRDPTANSYCTGSHSLLSERLARNRCLKDEIGKERASRSMRPCPRTCRLVIGLRALSLQTKVVHQHPFGRHQETHQIDGTLEPGSVFTWPFRLSMAQSQATIKRQGRYFGDLEPRLDRYCKRLSPAASLVFFYLNYDNPVSADEYKYTLVGCARLKSLDLTGHFLFEKKDLDRFRSRAKLTSSAQSVELRQTALV